MPRKPRYTPYHEIIVRDLSEFIEGSISLKHRAGLSDATISPWYRGQSAFDWGLIPKLYRGDPSRQTFEREVIRDFRMKAVEFLSVPPQNDVEWMFLAQHHGLPTRLLDWSENPLVSLFFACTGSDQQDQSDGAVWVMNPWRFNSLKLGNAVTVPTVENKILSEYALDTSQVDRTIKSQEPLAIRTFYNFRRSNAQSGNFTLHGSDRRGLEEFEVNEPDWLFVIRIPAENKLVLRKRLFEFGVHAQSLFPTLEGVCQAIRYRYGPKFMKVRN